MVENLSNSPQQTKNQQDAHEWRQVGDGLEDGHKAQTAYTKPEDDVALRLSECANIGLRQILLLIKLALELVLQNECRYKHRYERWNKYLCKHTLSGDYALNPEHDGGNVANGREGAS